MSKLRGRNVTNKGTEKKYCYNCKFDVRDERGNMADCTSPNRVYCTANASYDGTRPWFEPKEDNERKDEAEHE